MNGTCSTCDDYTHPDADALTCIADVCTDIQKLEVNGTCTDCEDYTRADETGKICRADSCDVRISIIKVDGTCESCGSHSYPDPADSYYSCTQDDCSDAR